MSSETNARVIILNQSQEIQLTMALEARIEHLAKMFTPKWLLGIRLMRDTAEVYAMAQGYEVHANPKDKRRIKNDEMSQP